MGVDRIELRPETSPPLFVPSEGHRGPFDKGVFREPAVPALGAHLFEDIPGEGQKVPGGVSELYDLRDDQVEEGGGVAVGREDGELFDDEKVKRGATDFLTR